MSRDVVQWIMARVLRTALIASLLCALAACHARAPISVPGAPEDPALTITGNPESGSGATWTLVGTLDGTTVDLQGILLKPRGRGPFPAVVLSHGAGGNAQSYGLELGKVMRTWGLVFDRGQLHPRPRRTPRRARLAAPAGRKFGEHTSRARRGHRPGAPRLRRRPARRRARSQHGRLRHHGVRRGVSRGCPRGVTHVRRCPAGRHPPRGHADPERRGGPAHPGAVSVAPRPPGLRRPVPSRQTLRLRPHRTPRGPSLCAPQSRRGRRPIPRCWRASGPGTPPTGCSSGARVAARSPPGEPARPTTRRPARDICPWCRIPGRPTAVHHDGVFNERRAIPGSRPRDQKSALRDRRRAPGHRDTSGSAGPDHGKAGAAGGGRRGEASQR